MNKEVTIIIPAYNEQRYIKKAVKSAVDQTLPPYQVIIIDDGSSDKTAEVIKKLQSQYKNIKYIYQENKGLGTTRNTGIKNSNTDLIATLDGNDFYDKKFLESSVDKMEETGADVIACNGYTYQESGKSSKTLFDIYKTPEKIDLKEELKGNKIFSTALIKKEALREVGYYRPMKQLEDYELWLRMLKKGKGISLVRKPLFYYRTHPKSLSQNRSSMVRTELKLFNRYKKTLGSKHAPLINKRISDCLIRLLKFKEAYQKHPSLKTFIFYFISRLSPLLAEKILNCKKG